MRTLQLWLATWAILIAQTPSPAVKSPEVHADRRITFRVRAPKANPVRFFGDWMKVGDALAMTRDGGGVRVTVGPMPLGIHFYSFTMDGVTMVEGKYRVKTDREPRAIAGLSMTFAPLLFR